MVLLIDTNVLIDNITARGEHYVDADKIFDFCSQDGNEGYVAFHSLPNVWYVLRKKGDGERRKMLKEICTRNVKDFANADTKVITPADFVKKFIDKVSE